MPRTGTPADALTLRIPYWIYDAGFFKGHEMGSVLQVFLCLVRYMDWHSGNGRLGCAKIAAATGLKDPETLSRAFTQLRQWGLVKVWWRRTDRGYIRYYQIAPTQAKMRDNAVTYLTLKAQRASKGYVPGNSRGRGTGISRSQCSSILYSKEATTFSEGSQPHDPSFNTAILSCLERA